MSDDPPNIVLVTADSVRADHCGFINDSSPLTPVLDTLADQGVAFESATAPGPRTPSSVPEIFSGEILPHADIDLNSYTDQMANIATHLDRYRTLAEQLADKGYSTAAYTANPYTTEESGFDAGFDEFHDIRSDEDSPLRRWGLRAFSGSAFGTFVTQLDQFWNKREFFSQWPSVFPDAMETVQSMEEPYFIWIFILDAHNPYIVPRADRIESSTYSMYSSVFRSNQKFKHVSNQSAIKPDLPPNVKTGIQRAYRDAIRSIDRFVYSLQWSLKDDDPVFVFHSDHGEAFNEHGTYGHQPELYDENIRVPLLVYDERTEIGERVQDPVSLRSLPDMLLSYLTGGEDLTSSRWQREYTVSRTLSGDKIAVRGREFKLISSDDGEIFYDLGRDPGERHPISEDDCPKSENLREALDTYLEQVPDAPRLRKSDGDTLSSDIQESLRALGYTE